MGEELARIADQAVLWLSVDAGPWLARVAAGLWQNHTVLLAFIGIILLYIRARAADRQARTGEQGHITDRFTKAIEQLGSERMAVRLGAIYALERLSRDSPEDHWTIMEVLTAYVRDNALWPPKEEGSEPEADVRPATDIQAILTALGRREEGARRRCEAARRYLDLKRTDLRGASLREAHLEGAELWYAHLGGANLVEAHLECAKLWEAHLEGAILPYAHLEGALLFKAHLEGAYPGGAHLQEAAFTEAHLAGCVLAGAQDLTHEQLNSAHGNQATTLPEGFRRPAHWPTNPPPSSPPPPEPPPDTANPASR